MLDAEPRYPLNASANLESDTLCDDAEEVAVQGPLRIAILTENFLPKVDGVTRTISTLLEHLRKEGHEAVVFGPEGGISTYAGHPVYGTWGIPLLWIYPGLSLNFFRPMFLRRLLEFQPDVVHYVIWLGTQAQPVIESYLPDVGAVSSYHTNLYQYANCYGFSFLVQYIWALQKRLHGRCKYTFCPSPSTGKVLAQQGFCNVRIWPRGVDLALFNPSKRDVELLRQWGASHPLEMAEPMVSADHTDKPKIVILYVGRISWEKNLAMLVEAARLLQHNMRHAWKDTSYSGFKLIFVGQGPAQADIQKMCDSCDVDATFTGQLQGDLLAAHYASADIFAFPSVSETFGNVVLEALASGLPVIGLRAEGVSDLVDDGKTGLLLSLNDNDATDVPDNAPELVDRSSSTFPSLASEYSALLQSTIVNDKMRLSMSEAAVKAAALRSWPAAMNCLIQGYRQVAAMSRQRSVDKFRGRLSARNSSSCSLCEIISHTPGESGEKEQISEAGTQPRLTARLANIGMAFRRKSYGRDMSISTLPSAPDAWTWRSPHSNLGRTAGDPPPLSIDSKIIYERRAARVICKTARALTLFVCLAFLYIIMRRLFGLAAPRMYSILYV